MNEPWIIYFLVFLLVAIATQQFQRGLGGIARDRQHKQKRFASLDRAAGARQTAELRRRSSRFGNSSLARQVNRAILQSGTSLGGPALLAVVTGLTLLLFLALPAPASAVLRLGTSAALAFVTLGLWLRVKRARRLARFGEQLPEVIDVIVRSLRAGHPLAVSLNLVAREMPEPAGVEFGLLIDEINYGRSLGEALENLYERVGYPELRFFVTCTAIAHQTGGNLGEVLSRLSRLLRERFRLARRARALSAEGRFSGLALSILPVALFAVINLVSPSYYADFWRSTAATPVVSVSVALLLVGNFVIYRLVNFRP